MDDARCEDLRQAMIRAHTEMVMAAGRTSLGPSFRQVEEIGPGDAVHVDIGLINLNVQLAQQAVRDYETALAQYEACTREA